MIHLESLLGKKVPDPSGACAGRLEEVRARRLPDRRCVVDDYLLGRGALLHRLSLTAVAESLLDPLGAHTAAPTHPVPWPPLDLGDPRRPPLKCAAEDLPELAA